MKTAAAFAILLSIFFISSQTPAADTSDFRLERPWLFLGLDAGYVRMNTDRLGEFNKNGFQINIKALGSYYWEKAVIDGGAGWSYQYLTGAQAPVASETITTRAILLEAAGRYRIDSHWQAGLISRGVFGDLVFGSNLDKYSFALLSGVQGVYEFPMSDFPIRLTAQALTDLTIADRQFYILEAGIQFGWAPFSNSPARNDVKPTEKTTLPLPVQGDPFYFAFGTPRLTPAAQRILKTLGEYLNSHQSEWTSLLIEGHTDSRGSDAYNLELSKARAKAVKAALISGGVSESRLEVAGYGFHKPKVLGTGPEVWRQNRRVELTFTDVKDPTKFRQDLQKMQNLH